MAIQSFKVILLQKKLLFAADRVREGDRGEGADEDDGAALLDALGQIFFYSAFMIFVATVSS